MVATLLDLNGSLLFSDSSKKELLTEDDDALVVGTAVLQLEVGRAGRAQGWKAARQGAQLVWGGSASA